MSCLMRMPLEVAIALNPLIDKQDMLSRVSQNIMKTVRFGDLMKHSYSAKPCKYLSCPLTRSDDLLKNDIRFKYFMSCRDNKTTVLPILHKIQGDGCLNLTNYTLSSHLAKSLG
jgi:hypothetical protein